MSEKIILSNPDQGIGASMVNLRSIAQELTPSLEIEELLNGVAKHAKETLQADLVLLYLYDGAKKVFSTPPLMRGDFFHKEKMQTPLKEGDVPYKILKKRESHFAPDAQTDPIMQGNFVEREKISSSAGLLLLSGERGERVTGILFVNYRKPREFDTTDKEFHRVFVTIAGIAIQNAIFRTALQEVDRSIAATSGPETLELILNKALLNVGGGKAKVGRIRVYDRGEDELKPVTIVGPLFEKEDYILVERGADECIVGRVVRRWKEKGESKVENVKDVRKDDDFTAFLRKREEKWKDEKDETWKKKLKVYIDYLKEVRSEIAVLLIIRDPDSRAGKGRLIGVLNLHSSEESAFNKEDESFLTAIADQLTVALQNAALFETVSKITSFAAETVEEDELLKQIVNNICELMKVSACTIWLIDKNEGCFKLKESAGVKEEYTRKIIPFSEEKKNIASKVFIEQEPLIIPSIKVPSDEVHIQFRDELLSMGFNSLISVPLIAKGHSIGTISIYTKDDESFIKYESELLNNFANQTALLIQNTKVTRQNRALQEIIKAIPKEKTIEDILRFILDRYEELAQFTNARIRLLYKDSERQELVPGVASGLLKKQNLIVRKLGEGIAGKAAEVGETICINDIWGSDEPEAKAFRKIVDETEDERYKNYLKEVKSEIAIPLKIEDEVVGVLNVHAMIRNAFTMDDKDILTTFASQAANAIFAKRMYTQRKLDELKKSMSSEFDCKKIAERIAEGIRTIFPERHKREYVHPFYLYNAESFKFDPLTIAGFSEEERELWLFPPRDDGVGALAIKERGFVNIQDLETDLRASPNAKKNGIITTGCQPLITPSGKPVGVMYLHFYKEYGKHYFTDEEKETIGMFAAQAAIAIDNALTISGLPTYEDLYGKELLDLLTEDAHL